jgi:hypothetical protein
MSLPKCRRTQSACVLHNQKDDAPTLSSERNTKRSLVLALAFSIALGAQQTEDAEQQACGCRHTANQGRDPQSRQT